jgi:phospholipid/cholesterol/gamma-HCH transport system ATP-binding protein
MTENQNFVMEMKNLRFSRGGRVIFDALDVQLERGLITAVMGPSGTGKTTFLQLLTRQLQPDHGDVLLNGESILNYKGRKLYQMRQRMSLLFQQGALFTDLNVFENVAFSLREHTNLSEDMIRDLVLLKLEAVGLRGAAYLSVSQLSGGMARRVALARAIMMDPEIIMYDEPFTGQDPISRGVLLKLIRGLNVALGLTTILISHDIQETLSIADRALVLADGGVLAYGRPEQLLESTDPALTQFLGGLPDGAVPFHYPAKSLTQELGL